jgi:hypothetical protein
MFLLQLSVCSKFISRHFSNDSDYIDYAYVDETDGTA